MLSPRSATLRSHGEGPNSFRRSSLARQAQRLGDVPAHPQPAMLPSQPPGLPQTAQANAPRGVRADHRRRGVRQQSHVGEIPPRPSPLGLRRFDASKPRGVARRGGSGSLAPQHGATSSPRSRVSRFRHATRRVSPDTRQGCASTDQPPSPLFTALANTRSWRGVSFPPARLERETVRDACQTRVGRGRGGRGERQPSQRRARVQGRRPRCKGTRHGDAAMAHLSSRHFGSVASRPSHTRDFTTTTTPGAVARPLKGGGAAVS